MANCRRQQGFRSCFPQRLCAILRLPSLSDRSLSSHLIRYHCRRTYSIAFSDQRVSQVVTVTEVVNLFLPVEHQRLCASGHRISSKTAISSWSLPACAASLIFPFSNQCGSKTLTNISPRGMEIHIFE